MWNIKKLVWAFAQTNFFCYAPLELEKLVKTLRVLYIKSKSGETKFDKWILRMNSKKNPENSGADSV